VHPSVSQPRTSEAAQPQPKPQPQGASPAPSQEAPKPAPTVDPDAEAAERARAAFRLREHERKLKADRDAFEAERVAFAQEKSQAAEERKQRESRESEYKSLDELSAIERLAKERGTTTDAVLRAALAKYSNGGQMSPEEKLAVAEKRALDAAENADRKAKELEEREEKRLREMQERADAQAYEETVNGFRQHYASAINSEKHPYLSALSRSAVAQRALDAANEYATLTQGADGRGLIPDTDELMAHLEKVEREAQETHAAKLGYIKAPPKPVEVIDGSQLDEFEAPRAPRVSSDVRAGLQQSGIMDPIIRDSRGRFVDNATAAARVHTSQDPRDMTEEQRLKRAAARIEQARTRASSED
jgi:hypothetical protein